MRKALSHPTLSGRKYVWLTLGYILFIYLTLPLLPVAVNWVKGSFGSRPIAVTGPGLFVILALYFLFISFRRGSVEDLLHLLTLLLASVMVLVYKKQNPVEQIHLVEYGLVGFLGYRASERRPGSGMNAGFILWAVIALASGIVDELIQALLPNRVCDPTDMVANVISAVVGMDAAALFAALTPPPRGRFSRPD